MAISITGTVADQPVPPTDVLNPFATVGITDSNFAPAKDVASIAITDKTTGMPTDADGFLTGAGLSKTGVGTYAIPNAVVPSTLTAELQNLTFNAPDPSTYSGTPTADLELDIGDVPPQGVNTSSVLAKDTTTSILLPQGSGGVSPERFDANGAPMSGEPYTGPVPGIQWQLIEITPDNLNITADVPNVFIHGGSGNDAIDVSGVNGTNVLDGSTGSNYLVGGTGDDTFYVDDRAPVADIWSSVVGFHSGDLATVWGITPQDFTITPGNNVVPDAPGLDFAITAPGQPNANLTIQGYSTADLSNGKLSMSFGSENGNPYMLIQAT